MDESYYLLESRHSEGRKVPLPAVNMVIEACALMGDLDRAFATWAELEALGLQADTGTYNALLHTCIRTREIASGRRLLARMDQDAIQPNALTFMHRCTLHLIAREDRLAVECLQKCKEANFDPPGKMYVGVINRLLYQNQATEALVRRRAVFLRANTLACEYLPMLCSALHLRSCVVATQKWMNEMETVHNVTASFKRKVMDAQPQ